MEIDKNNKILKPKKLIEFQRKKVKMKNFRFSLTTMKIETKHHTFISVRLSFT